MIFPLDRLQSLAALLAPVCDEPPTLKILPPANLAELAELEEAIGRPLPPEVRTFLRESAGIDFSWSLSDQERDQLPEALQDASFSSCYIGAGEMANQWENWLGWRDTFEHPEHYVSRPSPYPFDDVFPLQWMMNGDMLIQVAVGPHAGRVVYLDHEGGELDQAVLAASLREFAHTWTELACVGPECGALVPFHESAAGRLTAEGELAQRWRRLVGLQTH